MQGQHGIGSVIKPSTPVTIKLFLSWSHKDQSAKKDLCESLEDQLAILDDVEFQWWEASHIQTGDDWRHSILQRLDECDYALQLLSPGFLASRFIVSEEIPAFTGDGPMKGVFPVGLKPIPLVGTARLHCGGESLVFGRPAGRDRRAIEKRRGGCG
jgi:hypothetical protein